MTYKIRFHQSGGNITITPESNASMPVEAYMAGQVESNTAYAVVDDDSEGNIIMQLMDMSVPRNKRCFYLIIKLKNHKPGDNLKEKAVGLFIIGTNLFENMAGIGPAHKEICAVLFQMMWRRGISKLFAVIRELQILYCKNQKQTKHLPWLESVTFAETKILSEVIAEKVGKK